MEYEAGGEEEAAAAATRNDTRNTSPPERRKGPPRVFQGPILRVQFVGNKFYETFASSTLVLVVFTSIYGERESPGDGCRSDGLKKFTGIIIIASTTSFRLPSSTRGRRRRSGTRRRRLRGGTNKMRAFFLWCSSSSSKYSTGALDMVPRCSLAKNHTIYETLVSSSPSLAPCWPNMLKLLLLLLILFLIVFLLLCWCCCWRSSLSYALPGNPIKTRN